MGFSTFKEFQNSTEAVASNILTNRLKKLVDEGILKSERSEEDRRVVHYRPTQKGLDLAPVMMSIIEWSDKYEEHGVPKARIQRLVQERDEVLAEILNRFTTEDLAEAS